MVAGPIPENVGLWRLVSRLVARAPLRWYARQTSRLPRGAAPMSLKFASPLLGYNNNVRYKGRVFHIQTEDSGAKYAHIITHLFMDGGRILKSVKTSYAASVDSDLRAEIVRDLMKQQHKAMAIALRGGSFDGMVEGNASTPPPSVPPLASSISTLPPPSAVAPEVSPLAPVASAEPVSLHANDLWIPPSRSSDVPAASPPAVPSQHDPSRPGLLDINLVERAAMAASGAPSVRHTPSDLPPPPPNLLREKTAKGLYRVAAKPAGAEASGSSTPPVPRKFPPTSGASPASARRVTAPARPASAFGQARPQSQSIFGEDLTNDKSLDEVILSYLAAELESEKK